MALRTAALASPYQDAIRRHFQGSLEGMRSDRTGFWSHWAQLAEVYLPRRYKWFISNNPSSRGQQINQTIIDETGVKAAEVMTSGMMSGMTSPTRQWFDLGLQDLETVPFGPVKRWTAEVKRRILRVMSESNFYTQLAVLYQDLGVFGSANMIIYEDDEDIIRCYNPCLGEFFFGGGPRLDVTRNFREYTLTVYQAVLEFGIENVSDSTAALYRTGGAALQTEIVIQHGIEPNTPLSVTDSANDETFYPVPRSFTYREVYWEVANIGQKFLRVAGFREKPFVGARWDVTSNDAYGRCPGMTAMPATRQLQIQQRRKAEAIEKQVRPPMNASVSMRNEPASILPGAINYVTNIADAGFKPAYTVTPQIAEMVQDIQETQARVKGLFFNDLFLMISSLDTVRTATEIDARREEKLIQLGPVIERFENEVLDPIIARIYAIMLRRGLIPEPPPEIAGMQINVQYVSMLAAAQKAAATAAMERFAAFVGNLYGVAPEALDTVDIDALLQEYADAINVPPSVIRSLKEIFALRKAKAAQAAQAQQMQVAMAGVQAAKTLSDTQVGGGINALMAMTQ